MLCGGTKGRNMNLYVIKLPYVGAGNFLRLIREQFQKIIMKARVHFPVIV